jgi:predicted dehydrogenase
MNRRIFVQAAGLGAAAWGANEKVNIAVVGLGGRGQDHIKEYLKQPDAQIVALCDVNQAALERSQAVVEKATGRKPKGFSDMRRVFEDKDVDAVSTPTPNHWHALGAIWAMQAGKDVYVEKPACHNVFEGRKMIEAARKYKRMVQVGSQSRSMPHKQKAVELVRQGAIGKVYLAKGLCYKRRLSIGRKPDSQTPPGVDWNLFLGPAPMRPFNELRFKYNWHWFWDTGNGDIGNQGVHEMDIARWGLDVGLPRGVVSTGGKYVYDDDQETPNTQIATFDYGDKEIVFEVRGLPTSEEGGLKRRGNNVIGNVFYGSDGYLAVDDVGFQVYKGPKLELVQEGKTDGSDTGPHMANFLSAVKSRKYQDLTAEAEIGVISADLCHLANISYRLKRRLNFDPSAEKFVGDEEANRMLTRRYRPPYVVPQQV